jgi:uncharacterized protein
MIDRKFTLIIFTRYPTPGVVKTRLIPAIGSTRAAILHRQMTESTVQKARKLSEQLPISLAEPLCAGRCFSSLLFERLRQREASPTRRFANANRMRIAVHFDGSNYHQMSDWLGADLIYQSQGEGDLGIRMDRSIASACQSGSERVVLIGTDCPDLTVEILAQAFKQLEDSDLVLGAAVDGGYYLIGMCQPQPELFIDIDWSTDRVLQQTISVAQRLNLAVSYLPTLADIDRPEDLPRLGAKISIVIPVLNEAATIAQGLGNLRALVNLEVIVVDGGSIDDTVSIVQDLGMKVISSTKGRAHQMNVGAQAATGEILLFLHADTWLPLGFEKMVRSTFQPLLGGSKSVPVAGAFSLKIDDSMPSLRWIEKLVSWRSQWQQMPYGDQAIFLTAATFWELEGFREMPIMEDFELMRRLQRRGKIEILAAPVITSARRWLKRGIWQTTLINQSIVIGYLVGISPARLATWYR